MVGRLAGEIVGPLAVLEDQDAVAVQAADHRPRRRRSERALADAGLGLQELAERGLALHREVLARQHGRRLVGLERIPRPDADRDDLRVMEVGLQGHVDLGAAARHHPRFDTSRGERLDRDGQVVGARCNALEAVAAVGAADYRLARFLQRDRDARERAGRVPFGDDAVKDPGSLLGAGPRPWARRRASALVARPGPSRPGRRPARGARRTTRTSWSGDPGTPSPE